MFGKNSSWAIGIAIVAVIAGFAFLSSNDVQIQSASSGSDGLLEFSEERWDIGNVSMADGLHKKTIKLTNTTDEAVTITSMSTSCMCTTGQIVHADGARSRVKGMPGHGEPAAMREVIEAGETASLVVVFDPNAHGPNAVGPVRRSIVLETSSAQQPSVKLSFSGNVTK